MSSEETGRAREGLPNATHYQAPALRSHSVNQAPPPSERVSTHSMPPESVQASAAYVQAPLPPQNQLQMQTQLPPQNQLPPQFLLPLIALTSNALALPAITGIHNAHDLQAAVRTLEREEAFRVLQESRNRELATQELQQAAVALRYGIPIDTLLASYQQSLMIPPQPQQPTASLSLQASTVAAVLGSLLSPANGLVPVIQDRNQPSTFPYLATASFPIATGTGYAAAAKPSHKPRQRSRISDPFPAKLHRLLRDTDSQGKQDIISFTESGKAFKVHNEEKFVSEIVPLYFRQKYFSSFTRQLNMYGFDKVIGGPDRGAFYHRQFQRDQPELAKSIVGTKPDEYKSHRHHNHAA